MNLQSKRSSTRGLGGAIATPLYVHVVAQYSTFSCLGEEYSTLFSRTVLVRCLGAEYSTLLIHTVQYIAYKYRSTVQYIA